MSWCDKLASTPAVGLQFDCHPMSSSSLLDAIAPLVADWIDGDRQKFNLTKQDPFALELNTDEGFVYGFGTNRFFVEFKHRMKLKAVSAGPPIAELISHPLPYTRLLPEVSQRLVDAMKLILSIKPRSLVRIGVVSTTIVDPKEAPPGITRFIEYVGRPWGRTPDSYNFEIVSQLDEKQGWTDRGIHQISKGEDSEALTIIKFDLQRTFTTARSITAESLKPLLASVQETSLKYFEDVAEGSRFDANVISETT